MRGCRRHQPLNLTCPTCAGRYARRTARAILSSHLRQLHGVNFPTTVTPGEFHNWRVAVRNLIDHQRRESRWWAGVSMQVWLGVDGQVRGVVALDAIMPEEFSEAFARWEPTMRRIGPEEVADVVLEAVRPDVIAHVDGGGHQSVRLTLRPKTVRCVVRPPLRLREVAVVEPMPLLL